MSNTTYWCEKKCQCCNIVRIADERNEQLRAEVERLRDDSRRWQWVKEHSYIADFDKPLWTANLDTHFNHEDITFELAVDLELQREVVDAAIEAATKGGGR